MAPGAAANRHKAVTASGASVTFDIEQDGSVVATGVTGTSTTVTGLTSNTTYNFRVRAVAAGIPTSDWSTAAGATTPIGPADGATSQITAAPTTITADGVSTSTITIQLVDADGNNLITGGDTVVLATTLGSLSAVVDNLNGTYTATLTSGLTLGTATISGTVNGNAIVDTADVVFN